MDGLVVSNGTFNVARISNDVITSAGDVFTLIGYAIIGAIILGFLYAVWLILNN